MTSEISRKLYLVIPIEQESRTLYAHCTPIDFQVFNANRTLLIAAFSALYRDASESSLLISGPRASASILRETAEKLKKQDEAQSLIAEIRRLTNVFIPEPTGWNTYPLEDAEHNKLIDESDAAEVENRAVFFTLIWYGQKKSERANLMEAAAGLWGCLTVLQNATDYPASLPILTPTVTTFPKRA